MVNGNPPSVSSLMSHLTLTFFCCVMGFYCSLFNYPLRIIIIAFSHTCVSVVALVVETISFSLIIIMVEITLNKFFMWHQFVGLNNLLVWKWRFTLSSGINILKSYHFWCENILYLLSNNKTLTLVVGRTYQFINEMTIPCLMYWTFAQMDVWFY